MAIGPRGLKNQQFGTSLVQYIPLFWAAVAPILGQNPVYRSQMEPLAMGVRHRAQTEGLEHGLRV